MKLKKIVSLGLISTLSLSILSGCSKKEDKSSMLETLLKYSYI